jgi:hypothetical protein
VNRFADPGLYEVDDGLLTIRKPGALPSSDRPPSSIAGEHPKLSPGQLRLYLHGVSSDGVHSFGVWLNPQVITSQWGSTRKQNVCVLPVHFADSLVCPNACSFTLTTNRLGEHQVSSGISSSPKVVFTNSVSAIAQ